MNTLIKIFILIALCSLGIDPVTAKGEPVIGTNANAPRLVVFEGFYNPA